MPLPGTPHVAKISLQFTNFHEGNKCENVFAVQDTTDAIFTNSAAFSAHVFASAVASLLSQISPFVILDGVNFEDVRTIPFGGVDYSFADTPGTNGAGGVQLPASTSLAVKKITSLLGRSGRGRWYWPIGSAGSLVDGNTVLPAVAVNIVAALVAFQAGVEGGAFPVEMGVLSYHHGGALRASGLFTQIDAWGVTDLNVDSQRRRLEGRGA